MKKVTTVFIGFALLSLGGCGDVSSNNKLGENRNPQPTTTTTTQGVEAEGGSSIASGINRERGAALLSYADEIVKTLNNTLSETIYRPVPLMEKDNEGSSVNVTTVNTIGRPQTDCGVGAFAGVDTRISDCANKNGDRATWDGTQFGAAGEGPWKLVMRSGTKEIWLDVRTGMAWSPVMTKDTTTSFNWCKASGNTEGNTTTTTINCTNIGASETICHDTIMDEVGTQIKWRLPTRNDFLQADLDGARFVLIKENATGLWTATMKAGVTGNTDAWIYHSKDGTLSSDNLANLHQVRCIGVPQR